MKTTEPAPRLRGADIGEADYSEGDSSYIAVVDEDRNMVSFEPSLHSGFGTGVVMGDLGFIFNCRGDYYGVRNPAARSFRGTRSCSAIAEAADSCFAAAGCIRTPGS